MHFLAGYKMLIYANFDSWHVMHI